MGYKKRMIRRIVIVGMLVFSLTYCGSTAVSVKEEVPENESANIPDDAENKESGGEKAESETPETRIEVSCYSERPIWDIPVFRAKDKESVKGYLSGMPEGYLTYKEVEERGVIQRIWQNSKEEKKQREKFDKQWLDFYQQATRKDLKWNVKKGEAYHDMAVEEAVVILSYTIEGDPIYDYLSCINGDYYFYSDNSRDAYGSGSYDGSYKDLRVINEKDENGNEYSSFYLVKDREMTNKEIKRMIQSEEGYDIEEIVNVYSLNYVLQVDSADSGATVEGYVKEVFSDSSTILICNDVENISNEEYMGDYDIPIEENTVISDGRTLDSIKQGDYVIVTYTGTLAETYPVQIDGIVAITVN